MSFLRAAPCLKQAVRNRPIIRTFSGLTRQPAVLFNRTPAPSTLPQLRSFYSSTRLPNSVASPPTTSIKLPSTEPRLSLTMTCTVTDCNTRSTHEFTKRSYEKGIVIIQCPGCKNRHLIADHLGWFKDTEGAGRTIEDIMRLKGEQVRKGAIVGENGDIEYYGEER